MAKEKRQKTKNYYIIIHLQFSLCDCLLIIFVSILFIVYCSIQLLECTSFSHCAFLAGMDLDGTTIGPGRRIFE
jgi:hypothetical protein